MTDPTAGSGPTHPKPPPGPPAPFPPPRLGEVIRDAEHLLAQAIATLSRQWDPTSGPSTDEDPWGPEAVDIYLGSAAADIRSALEELATITTLGLPPAGSAVQFAARQAQSCLSGGSSSHLTGAVPVSGGRSPGLVDAAAPTSGGTDESRRVPPHPEAGASSDPRRRLSQRAPIGNGVTPGVGFTLPVMFWYLQVGAEFVASINAALARRSR